MSHTIIRMGTAGSDAAAAMEPSSRPVRGIETIVAFSDFSAHATAAVRRAAQLAAQHGARLRVAHIVAPPPLIAAQAWRESAEAHERIEWAEAELLARHAGALDRREGRLAMEVIVGSPVEEILRLSGEGDLLVLGARGTNAVKDLLVGSTATRLLTRCDRPMLVVKEHDCDPYRRVLVPLDLQDDGGTTLQATRALVPDAEVHVLHAYQFGHESMLRRVGVDPATLRRSRQDARAKVQSQLVAVLARAERNAQRVHRHLKQGHPVRMILAAETRIRADLIVMSKRSRSKVEDALIGSTTKRVVLDAHGDVLVVPLLAGDAARER